MFSLTEATDGKVQSMEYEIKQGWTVNIKANISHNSQFS